LDEECEVDGVYNFVGNMVKPQLVEEYEETGNDKDGLNDDGEHDLGEWGMTQLIEDPDEGISDDELSGGTVVLIDNEILTEDERGAKSGMDKRDTKLGLEESIEGLNGWIKQHDDNNNLVDYGASTDEDGDTSSG
jgi:mediator of DNA damage checkpoint protein 1